MPRNRTLLSWTGKNREPHTFRGGEVVPGAHLQLIRDSGPSFQFDRHFLFAVTDTMRDAEDLVSELSLVPGAPATEIALVEISDPSDLSQIVYALNDALLALDDEHSLLADELFILLNCGTPQMQATWLLLTSHGLIDARILQTSPPPLARRSGNAAARETQLDITAWQAQLSEVTARQAQHLPAARRRKQSP